MDKADGKKVVNFIESYYRIKLSDKEIESLSEELRNHTYNTFISEIKDPLLVSVDFFTIAQLHRIIENNKQANYFLKRMEAKSWNDFLAN